MGNINYIPDVNYTYQKKLKEVLKHLHKLVIDSGTNDYTRFELETAIQLLDELLKKETEAFKPTTKRLKELINNALLQNRHGDGVIVRILKKENAQIEKCSLLNFMINE